MRDWLIVLGGGMGWNFHARSKVVFVFASVLLAVHFRHDGGGLEAAVARSCLV